VFLLGFVRPSRQMNFKEEKQAAGKPNLSCIRGVVKMPHPPKAVFVLGLQPFGLPLPALKACFFSLSGKGTYIEYSST